MRSPIRLPLIAMLATAAIVLASCGSGSSKASPASTTDPATASTTEPTTTEAGNDKPTGTQQNSEEFCKQMEQYFEIAARKAPGVVDPNQGPNAEQFAVTRQQYADMDQLISASVEIAPGQIKADLQTMADMYEKINAKIASAGSWDDFMESAGNISALGLNGPKIEAANGRIGSFIESNCSFASTSE